MLGFPLPFLHEIPPVVGTVEPGSPAAAAGLQPGDRWSRSKGQRGRRTGKRWRWPSSSRRARPVPLTVERDGKRAASCVVVPAMVPQYEVGDAGVYPKVLPKVSRVIAGGPARRRRLPRGRRAARRRRPAAGEPTRLRRATSRRHAGKPVRGDRRSAATSWSTCAVTPRDDGSGKGRIGVELAVAVKLPPWQGAASRACATTGTSRARRWPWWAS